MQRPAPVPPVAAVRPHVVESPHGNRADEYYWLRDDTRTSRTCSPTSRPRTPTGGDDAPTRGARGHGSSRRSSARIKQDDSTVPYRLRGYWYYTRYETGKEYPIYARKAGTLDAPEQVLLDGNAMAEARLLPGRRDARSRRTATCSPTPRTRSAAASSRCASRTSRPGRGLRRPHRERQLAHSPGPTDNRTLLYVEKDPETLLGFRVQAARARHRSCAGRARLRGGGRRASTSSVDTHQGRALRPHRRAEHRPSEWRYRAADDPALGFGSSCRASATTSTTSTTSTAASSSAPTGRRRTSASWRRPIGEEGDRASWRELLAHRDDAFVDGLRRLQRLPRRQRAQRRAAQDARPCPGAAGRPSSSPPTSRRTRWASARTRSIDTNTCATATPRSPRPPRSTTTTSRPASASC